MKKSRKKIKIIKNLIIICLIYVIASSFYNVLHQIYDYKKQVASLNKEIKQETAINKELGSEKLKMESDENYKEIARKTLGLVDPGDKVYVNKNDANSK